MGRKAKNNKGKKFCGQCGTRNDNSARYCMKCGAEISYVADISPQKSKYKVLVTQTSHTQNGIRTLKNQYFSPQSILK